MPSRKYRITEDAKFDLHGIAAYIAQDRPSAGVRVLEILQKTFRSLADSPEMGESCEHLGTGLRKFVPGRPAHRYVVFYRQSMGNVAIDIVAVIHGARDASAVLER